MALTLNELIQQLEDIKEDLGTGDIPVVLAIQPSYPFEHSIGRVVPVNVSEAAAEYDEMERAYDQELDSIRKHSPEDVDKFISEFRAQREQLLSQPAQYKVYIGEAGQTSHLCVSAIDALEW